ncbi:hypothetical protein Bhyg_12099, partial [Pseudolycoriella hygida]
MKSHFFFILCGVLIFGVIAEDAETKNESGSGENSDELLRDCTVIYLKSKGKLEAEPSNGKRESFCVFGIQLAIRAMRELMENKMKKNMPNEAKCLMEELDKKQEAATDALEKQVEEKMKDMGVKCGVAEEKMQDFMDDGFDSSEENASSEDKSKDETTNTTD